LQHQPVPAQPIDLDIPLFALYEALLSPIEEIPIVLAESLFEHQCRDQLAQRIREQTSIDPLLDSENIAFCCNGYLQGSYRCISLRLSPVMGLFYCHTGRRGRLRLKEGGQRSKSKISLNAC
jgi:hypothetical protein